MGRTGIVQAGAVLHGPSNRYRWMPHRHARRSRGTPLIQLGNGRHSDASRLSDAASQSASAVSIALSMASFCRITFLISCVDCS